MQYTIHPECKDAVIKEYARLTRKNPDASREVKLRLAKEYVYTCQYAETMRFLAAIGVACDD